MQLTSIFETGGACPPNLTEADETATIAAAQAGDTGATETLMAVYAPALRSAVLRYGKRLPREDAEATALVALCEAINAHDGSTGVRRLGPLLRAKLAEALTDADAAAHLVTVHPKAVQRYRAINRRCGSNLRVAADLAPKFGLSREGYVNVHNAVTPYTGLEEVADRSNTEREVLMRETVRRLASAPITERQRRVIVLAFGLDGGEPMSDSEVAAAVGVSRPTVWRERSAALETIRAHFSH